jgi:hypothetical protein
MGKYQRVQLLNSIVKMYLILLDTDKLSSKVASPFCIPISNDQKFLLLQITTSIWIFSLGFGNQFWIFSVLVGM